MNQDNVRTYIYLLCIIFVFFFLYKQSQQNSIEKFTVPPNEVLQNLSSLYNSQKLTTTNLVTGVINGMDNKPLTITGTVNIDKINSSTINQILQRLSVLESRSSYVYVAAKWKATTYKYPNSNTIVNLNSIVKPSVISVNIPTSSTESSSPAPDFSLNPDFGLVYNNNLTKKFNLIFNVTFTGSMSVFDVWISKNGVTIDDTLTSQLATATSGETGRWVNYSINTIVNLSRNDVINSSFLAISSNFNMQVISFNMSLVEIR